jgi:signal transduction histidine kinase/ActR/RegA family two-component response regulator
MRSRHDRDRTDRAGFLTDAHIRRPREATGDHSLQQYQFEQDLLLEVSQAVSATLDLGAVVQIIADGTARLLGVETTAVYLLEGERLYLEATTPPLDPSMPETLRWARREDHPHIGSVLATEQPLVLADAPRADLSPAERAVVELRQLRSLLFLPFCHAGKPIGVLILGTVSDQRTFGAHDIDLCRTLTNELAIGIQNARLHSGLKAYAAELEARIQEQARLSEQLRQAQKMEAIGLLAGGVAHDFNNLLQVIHGFTELAREKVEPEGAAQRSLGMVLQATERARVLVGQLLAFGRRQPLRMKRVDVNRVVHDLLPMLKPLLGARVALLTRCAADIPAVRADPNQLEQVLLNLCINARDAMPQGGSLTMRTQCAQVDSAGCRERALPGPGGYVVVAVEDTGRGMDPDTRRRAFEPFFTTKAPGEGTGLGLSSVHGIVAQHGGATRIVSEVGLGTTVEVYLPVLVGEEATALSATQDEAPGGSEVILLAEDHEMVRTLAQTFLESAGYTVLLARDGEEAMRIVAEHSAEIDLALLDLVMPNVSGEEVFQRLRAHRPDVPVVFSTGYAPESSNLDLAKMEGVDLLQKPYGRKDLLRTLRRALDERSAKAG